MRVLGIETSCDETGIAIFDSINGLVSNKLYSQAKLHSQYGGVVPELASRDHIRKIIPLIQTSLKESHLDIKDIDAIAYTAGPGLIGSLLVGAVVGCSLAYSLNIPAVPIHHIEAHLLVPMLEKDPPKFPFMGLLISGGHTQLINVSGIGQYQLLGESIDDAVGEVFDKVAQLLGLGYPGGPAISKLAKKGIAGHFVFPRPMTVNRSELNFSFSGLKSSVINAVRNSDSSKQTYANIACDFENTIIDILMIKCERALNQTNLKRLVVSGGVSANFTLRKKFKKMMNKRCGEAFYARPEFCTDNGAMIAYVGMLRLEAGEKKIDNSKIFIRSRWSIEEISKI